MELITPAPEFRDDVPGKEFGVASGDVDIHIGHTHEAVQHGLKFPQQLHLIQEDVIHPIVHQPLLHGWVQDLRVPELFILKGIKGNFNNMIPRHPLLQQMPLKKRKQQIGLAAPPHTGDHFDKAIVLPGNEFMEIPIPFDFHGGPSY